MCLDFTQQKSIQAQRYGVIRGVLQAGFAMGGLKVLDCNLAQSNRVATF